MRKIGQRTINVLEDFAEWLVRYGGLYNGGQQTEEQITRLVKSFLNSREQDEANPEN